MRIAEPIRYRVMVLTSFNGELELLRQSFSDQWSMVRGRLGLFATTDY